MRTHGTKQTLSVLSSSTLEQVTKGIDRFYFRLDSSSTLTLTSDGDRKAVCLVGSIPPSSSTTLLFIEQCGTFIFFFRIYSLFNPTTT